MGARILVIEDEVAINDVICLSLVAAGHEVDSFLDGEKAGKALKKRHDYGCAVVDVMLPGKDGFALLPELVSYGIPVIFLTARGELPDKIRGLTGGAEDYMVKPFEMVELLVRINKVLERHSPSEAVVTIGDVIVDPAEYSNASEPPFYSLRATSDFNTLEPPQTQDIVMEP
ncbi:MAG: response regulator transcription factor [Lachnospiraceae bacterium]|nr:response regulator transcription factor [Lachnospiraceae bacterium]